jgi:hypothetical protein
MIERKKKICVDCGEPEYIWANKKCKPCHYKSKPPKEAKRVSLKKSFPKPTGELALFKAIWENRPHFCAICNEPLGEFNVSYFSHLLPKSAFPKFRLYDKNLMLKCEYHHHIWGTKAKSDLINYHLDFKKAIDLAEEIMIEYYNPNLKENQLI